VRKELVKRDLQKDVARRDGKATKPLMKEKYLDAAVPRYRHHIRDVDR